MLLPPQCLSVVVVVVLCALLHPVKSHGWLDEPPARSSLWKYGYNTPPNYNHHELNCGGRAYMISQGGKCGLCGDPYGGVRQNEAGGIYATGIITRTYRQGQVIQIVVQLTAAHAGYYEFKLCSNNNVTRAITQECLDKHVLTRADKPGETRFTDVPPGSPDPANPRAFRATMMYNLPASLTCSQCVLQWRYITAHNGPPFEEEFYGCSDIAIVPSVPNTATPLTVSTGLTQTPTVSTSTTRHLPKTTSSLRVTTKQQPVSTTPSKVSTTSTEQISPTVSSKSTDQAPRSTPLTPGRRTSTTTTSYLSYEELYVRCRARGVLDEIFTSTCRGLCLRPSGCPKAFCNTYCMYLQGAKP